MGRRVRGEKGLDRGNILGAGARGIGFAEQVRLGGASMVRVRGAGADGYEWGCESVERIRMGELGWRCESVERGAWNRCEFTN